MELLTNRLVMLVEQVAENQMADLINKEKIQKQRLSERAQRETMLSFELQAAENQARRSKKSSNLATLQRSTFTRSAFGGLQKQAIKEKDQDKDCTKITTVCDIWGLSKKVKEAKEGMNKTAKIDDQNDISDGNKPKLNVSKFRKAAKLTVLLESMKEGKAVCTCENLDARCKLHDT